jgi:hypothetical protein
MKRVELSRVLTGQFTIDELQELCSALSIDQRILRGRSKKEKVERLLDYCQSRSLLPQLELEIRRRRPSLLFPDEDSAPLHPDLKERRKMPTEVVAALITGVFGLLTVIVTLVVPRFLPEAPASPAVIAAEAASPFTTPEATPTFTPEAAPTFTPEATPTSTPETVPTPSVESGKLATIQTVIGLPESGRTLIKQINSSLLELAAQLPLMIRDGFDNNDYGWPLLTRTDYGAVFCEVKIQDGSYQVAIETKTGPGYCYFAAPRGAQDFFLEVDTSTQRTNNATLWLLFRQLDNDNKYYLGIISEKQQYMIGQFIDGQPHPLEHGTFVGEIDKDGENSISILAVGDQVTFTVNGMLLATLTDPEPRFGSISFQIYLDEAHASDVFSIDNFVLRGE